MLTLADIPIGDAAALLRRYDVTLVGVGDDAPIPGSYWGDPEAGVIGHNVYVRGDTPVHSLLHEACHLIVAPAERRARIHTNASESQAEEDATCYLQILLGDSLPGVGRERIMADMDEWGYTFRLGSARAWFERDAEDARAWLDSRGLLPLRKEGCPTSLSNRTPRSAPMQRWLKLPDGRYIDANSIVYVGKVETYPRLDDDGNDAGQGYSVPIGTDVMRENYLTVMGTKEEVLALLKLLLGGTSS